jgi:small conductance mechanosensitive channel
MDEGRSVTDRARTAREQHAAEIANLGPLSIPASSTTRRATAAALGFALRDAVSNLLAGILIILYQPFRVGDRIEVAGSAGTVVGINLRYTVLDAADMRILLPNSTLLSNSVVVYRAAGEPPKP